MAKGKIDRNKVLATAQKMIQRGDLPKAVAQYETLLEAQPKDVQSLLRLAGLYIRVDRADDAVTAYMNAGEQYSSTGFYQKAVAAYKQALQLRPEDPRLLHQLGLLYQQMGLKSPAVEHFTKAAAIFSADGKNQQAVECMGVVLELEPDRPDLKARYGEYLFQAGQKDDAVAVFRGLVEILKLEGQWEDLARFYERIVQMTPDDHEIGLDLARTYLRLGLAPKALQRLKTLFDGGVRDAEVFDLLARAYVLLGKNGKAVSAYLEKAKRLAQDNNADEVEKTYRRILEIDPTNEQALEALGEGEDEQEVLQVFDDTPEQRETVVEVVTIDEEPASAAGGAVADESAGEYSEILQEASVYIRYGIKEKAVKKLDQILSKDPNNLAALKKRIEVYADSEPPRTIADLVKLSEIYEGLGDLDAAERYIGEAKAIDANHPALKAYFGMDAAADQIVGGTDGPVAEVVQSDDQMYPDADDFLSEDPLAGTDGDLEDELDIELDIDMGEDTADEVVAEAAPAAPPVAPVPQAQEVVAEAAPPDFSDELEQVEFFLDTGLDDEARTILDDLVAQHGRLPQFEDLLARLDTAAAPEPEPEPAPAAAPAPTPAPAAAEEDGLGGIFDIAKELEAELDFDDVADVSPGAEDVPTFDEIFDAFKKGVKEQLSDEDADAHYDLGIAYMEMGIMNEAINEFEIALASPVKAPDAYNMMAITLTRSEDFAGAVEKYRAGLALEGLDEAIMLNMNYEAALLLEELGDYREALLHFKNVVNIDKTYRDIEECLRRMRDKIKALKAGQATVA